MAKVTFSANGIPVGRNKTTSSNRSTRWTNEEDAYLRIAVERGLSTAEVASKLGRTPASIQSRKWSLGINGRLTKSPKGAKEVLKTERKARVEGYVRNRIQKLRAENSPQEQENDQPGMIPTVADGIQLFKIESVPLPNTRTRNEPVRDNLRKLLDEIKTGESFAIPKDIVNTTRYLINKEYASYKMNVVATSPEKKFYRVYRLA